MFPSLVKRRGQGMSSRISRTEFMSYEFFIAKRYLRSKRKSKYLSVITLISIGGVLIGVAALTFVLSMMNGFEREVRSHYRHNRTCDRTFL